MNYHLWAIPLLPLAGAAINGLAGRHFSRRTVSAIALLFTALAFAMALFTATQFLSAAPSTSLPYIEGHGAWIAAGDLTVDFAFYLDQLSLVMLLVVTGIGFLIHIYAVGYMWEEGGFYRFFAYLNLFMFFMLVLVLAGNYLLMFVGWEGVGLASYLLVGFYFLKRSAADAGKKAFLVNRVGDFAFLLGMFLMFRTFGALDFAAVFKGATNFAVETGGAGVITAIALLLMVGATGKSAQIPLYVWLPDAMEGPTPVSALIHAATMVTAGIYMIARSNPIFSRSPIALTAVAIIGCLTAIFAATIGMVQTDIKRVLAYSTISQLGYMFLACGVAAYSAAIFHLMTHAFFKALLFLAAGSVIHGLGGEQDMRRMGGLRKQLPWTFAVMTVGTFAIAGTPLLSGFFSKDQILWKTWSSPYGNHIYWAVAVLTALLTSFYMFRLWFLTFFGDNRAHLAIEESTRPHKETHHGDAAHHADPGYHDDAHPVIVSHASSTAGAAHFVAPVAHDPETAEYDAADIRAAHAAHASGHAHESPWIMLAPLVILALLSIFGGYVGVPRALGGSNRFDAFLAPVFNISSESMPAGPRPAESSGYETPVAAPHQRDSAAGEPSSASSEHTLGSPSKGSEPGTSPSSSNSTSEGTPVSEEQNEGRMELLLTAVSVAAAALGFALAWLLYHRRRDLPARITAHLGGLYDFVVGKYFVDEAYRTAFVAPLLEGSRLLWRGIDIGLIDAAVNQSAHAARGIGGGLRRMQSGSIRSYAAWVAAGAALVIGYMLWIGVRS